MAVTTQQLHKLASLSRLRFDDQTLGQFAEEFKNILQFVEKIQEAETVGVPPLTTTAGATSTPERPDEVTEVNRRTSYQQTAPQSEMGFYVVPKIVE